MPGGRYAPTVRLSPFRAWHPAGPAPADERVCPVYDTLDEPERARYATRPFGAARFTVARPGESSVEFGARADAEIEAALRGGAYVRDTTPGFYVYGIGYTAPEDIAETLEPAERRSRYLLLGLVGALGDAEDLARSVRTHERTFVERVEERRRLFEATGRQFAPIVLGYGGDDHALNDRLERELGLDRRRLHFEGAEPLVRARLDGTEHLLWRLDADSDAAAEAAEILAHRRALVLDGHHRFAAAAALRSAGRAAAPVAMLVERRDRALLLRPWHRVGAANALGFPDANWEEAVRRRFPDAERRAGGYSVENAIADLSEIHRSGRAGFVAVGRAAAWAVRDAPRTGAADDAELLDAWLDSAATGASRSFVYDRSPRRALERIATADPRADEPLAFLLPGLSAAAIEERAFSTGEPLPPKTTMFLPKVAEGVLFASIEAD